MQVEANVKTIVEVEGVTITLTATEINALLYWREPMNDGDIAWRTSGGGMSSLTKNGNPMSRIIEAVFAAIHEGSN